MRRESLDEQYEHVISAAPETERREFGRFCRLVIEAVDEGQLTIEEGAYRICGTAARILEDLADDAREIMTIGGNLELPEGHRDPTLPDWNGLKERIHILFPTD